MMLAALAAVGVTALSFPRARVVAALTSPDTREAIVAALRSALQRKAAPPAPTRQIVRIASITRAPGRDARYTGVVRARYESALGFRVAGKILERLVDAGEHVHKDQPLMRLDPTDLDLALRAARSEVDAATAAATQTAADEARLRYLVDKGQASQQVYDRGKAAADSAAAKLVSARAQAHQAEDQAAYAILRADADGIVMDTSGEPGQVVALGQPVLHLARDGAREAEVYIPEGDIRVEAGSATLYAGDGTWFPAQLRERSVAADPQTRTFRARYVLDGAGRHAPLGTTVTLRVPRPLAADAVSVPTGAIFDDGGGTRVWIVDPASAEVTARAVHILRVGDEDVSVTGDLAPGDKVVALGAHLLKAGEKVAFERTTTDTAAR